MVFGSWVAPRDVVVAYRMGSYGVTAATHAAPYYMHVDSLVCTWRFLSIKPTTDCASVSNLAPIGSPLNPHIGPR
eukprot:12488639-Alexandrium_andersonii.AAC.1